MIKDDVTHQVTVRRTTKYHDPNKQSMFRRYDVSGPMESVAWEQLRKQEIDLGMYNRICDRILMFQRKG